MSAADVEAIRAVYERWAAGDFWTPEIFQPDVEVIWADLMPDLSIDYGPDALAASMKRYIQMFERCTISAESFHDLGDRVLVLALMRGLHAGSSVAMDWHVAHLWTMRDGRAAAVRGYAEQADALRDAGLAP